MKQDFRKYTRSDYLKALGIAPLASIPVVILVVLLVIVPPNEIITSTQSSFKKFTGWANLLLMFSIPTAYVSTAFFGWLGFLYANARRYRGTPVFGAAVGLVCGAATGIGWILFLPRENFDLEVLLTGFAGAIILPISILTGLIVGAVFVKVINRSAKRELITDET